jgi:hypothetical protein
VAGVLQTVKTAATPSHTRWYTGQLTPKAADARAAVPKHVEVARPVGLYAKVP